MGRRYLTAWRGRVPYAAAQVLDSPHLPGQGTAMDQPDTGTVAGAIGVIAATLTAAWGWLKSNRESKRDENIVIANQQQRIAELVAEVKEATARADAFAAERNKLVVEFSDMRAQLESLKVEVRHMTQSIQTLGEQNAALTSQLSMKVTPP